MCEACRRDSVHGRLYAPGATSVRDPAGQFAVSAVTIRRDFAQFGRRGPLGSVHVGGIRTSSHHDEGSFSYRLSNAVEAKRDLARPGPAW